MTAPFSGHALVSWGEPCACQGAAVNPPSAADLAPVVDFLGEATAVGVLAARLGMPEGKRLLAGVKDFIDTSTTFGAVETGSVWDTLLRGGAAAESKTASLWAKVETSAGKVLKGAAEKPTLLLGAGALGVSWALGSQFLTTDERVKLTRVANDKALTGETLSRLSPEEAARLVKEINAQTAGAFGGASSWLPWVGFGLAVLLIWKMIGGSK